MQRQDTLRNLLVAVAVVIVVMWFAPTFLAPPRPAPNQTTTNTQENPPAPETNAGGAPTTPGEPSVAPSTAASTTPPSTPPATSTAGVFSVAEAGDIVTDFMGAPLIAEGGRKVGRKEPYRMRLTVSNVGASIETATMTDHSEVAQGADRYELMSLSESGGKSWRSLAIEKINVDGVDVPLRDKRWHLVRHEAVEHQGVKGEQVEFGVNIQRGSQDVLRLSRTFRLPEQPYGMGRYDVYSELTVTNLSPEPHQVVVAYQGGVGVRQLDPRMDDRFFDVGLRSGSGVVGARKSRAEVYKTLGELPLYASTKESVERVSWAAVANTYFTCTLAPLMRNNGEPADYMAGVSAFDGDGQATTENDVNLRFVTKSEQLAAGATLSYPVAAYIGQKDADAFKAVPEYRERNYYFQVAQGYGYCTFSWLVTLMIWLLNHVYAVVPDFGLAIIVLVLIVRALLHPITKKGQINMVRMQHKMAELQPKIEEIKKKFGNDRARMNQEMMKLNINPAGQLLTCLPMLIQMPIWVALYLSLSHNIDMRHEPFLFTWIRDLTAQDALYTFTQPLNLFGIILPSFNLLPFLVALTMYIQQKLQPKPKPNPNMSEEQRMQQDMMLKMMPMMSIMMLFIFYKMPSGLNLYIMASSIFGSIEQWHIRKDVRRREAEGTLHKPVRPSQKDPVEGGAARSAPSFFGRMQQLAEEAQKRQRLGGKSKEKK